MNISSDLGLRAGLSNLTDRLQSASSNTATQTKSINSNAIRTEASDFNEVINKQISPDKTKKLNAEDFKNQVAEIKKLGAAVRKYFTPGVVTDYLTAVHSLLTGIKDQAYEGESTEDGLFERVKIVNEELDQIAKDYFKDQSGELKVAASLDLVEGMLVDLIA